MSDYQLGKIYKIECNITGKIYIGSTIQKYLSSRLAQHNKHFKKHLLDNTHKYLSSYEILKNNDYSIILLEKYPCNDNLELRQRERYYYDLYECVNKLKPFQSDAEKKACGIKCAMNFYNNNREHVKDYRQGRDLLAVKCDCGGQYKVSNKSGHIKSNKHLKYLKLI